MFRLTDLDLQSLLGPRAGPALKTFCCNTDRLGTWKKPVEEAYATGAPSGSNCNLPHPYC